MKPTEELKKEHQAVLLMLKIMDSLCAKLKDDEVDPDHLLKIVDFIEVFVDKCHHGKEELILFPAMEVSGIPVENGPLGVMMHEHTTGRNCVRGMNVAANEYKNGNLFSKIKFREKWVPLACISAAFLTWLLNGYFIREFSFDFGFMNIFVNALLTIVFLVIIKRNADGV